MRAKHIVAIDPDATKSGLAYLDTELKSMSVSTEPFPQLIDYLKNMHVTYGPDLHVIVEAGWLNESHWHINPRDSRAVVAAKGNAVGRNAETGRKIVEMCKHYSINVTEIHPLKKTWRGPEGKITHDEISRFVPGFPKRSNQEVRDAALIAWVHAGFPIRIPAIYLSKKS